MTDIFVYLTDMEHLGEKFQEPPPRVIVRYKRPLEKGEQN